MEHDVNNILDNLASTYANQLAQTNKQVAILAEENRLLKEENESVKKQLKEQVEVDAE